MSVNLQAFDAREFGNQALKIVFKQKAVIAIGLMLFVMLFSDTNFYSMLNIRNVFSVAAPNLIIAFGVTFAVICRGCDLSVGSVMSLSGILAIQMVNSGMNMFAAIMLAVLSGAVVGFINGFLIVHQKTEAFIITLGMGMLVKGIALYLTDANPVPSRNLDFMMIANGRNFFGIPIPFGMQNIVVYMLLLGLLAFVLLRFTSFGRNIYALGGDYEVAEHSGISVIFTKWAAFTLCGTFAAIAGVLNASMMNTGSAIYGDAIPLMVNCGVVIGGTSFAGGVGGIMHSFIGIMVMELLRNCMNAFTIGRFIQTFILGVVIVSIICMDCYAIKRKKEDV
ncbi:MAG: ABC transporter permease [Defluviitaleaceae bacterium]|nr:ABC transporter permease [Defluviitaleaceae bacterium]